VRSRWTERVATVVRGVPVVRGVERALSPVVTVFDWVTGRITVFDWITGRITDWDNGETVVERPYSG